MGSWFLHLKEKRCTSRLLKIHLQEKKNARKDSRRKLRYWEVAASGKGGFTKEGNKYGIPDSKHQVTIDPDEVKAQLPEYALEKDRDIAAAYAHEESSTLGKRIMQTAIQNGYDYTLDGTGDNSAKTMMEKIEAARQYPKGKKS